ncbi:MAG: hypothetical protein ACKO0Z_05010 [Betaproteobacteria bacterium]
MSAYVMSVQEIAPIVEFAVQHRIAFKDGHHYRAACTDNASAIGQILLAENVRSVNARYREASKVPTYVHPKFTKTRQLTDHFRMLHDVADAASCLDYQSCETDDWTATEAHAILARVNAKLARLLVAKVARR